jgi:hypothetical protein
MFVMLVTIREILILLPRPNSVSMYCDYRVKYALI